MIYISTKNETINTVKNNTITILTVIKNAKSELPATLQSVAEQSRKPDEHIICVGMPDDGSLEILRNYEAHIISIKVCNDTGLYNALNQAIKFAKSEYILFLHAGDQFGNVDYLKDAYDQLNKEKYDVLYGNVLYLREDNTVCRKWIAKEFKSWKLHTGWMPPHTTCLIRKDLYEQNHGFCEKFKISADYKFLRALMLNKNLSFGYLKKHYILMSHGGISTDGIKAHMQKILEDFRAIQGPILYKSIVVIGKRLQKISQSR